MHREGYQPTGKPVDLSTAKPPNSPSPISPAARTERGLLEITTVWVVTAESYRYGGDSFAGIIGVATSVIMAMNIGSEVSCQEVEKEFAEDNAGRGFPPDMFTVRWSKLPTETDHWVSECCWNINGNIVPESPIMHIEAVTLDVVHQGLQEYH